MMDCPECGRKLPVGKKRCIYCGGMAPDEMEASAETEKGRGTPSPGEDRVHVEEWTVSYTQGDLEGENDTLQGTEFDETSGTDMDEKNLVIPFATEKGKTIKPMNRVLLVLIFFASAAVMGALVWLMG